MSTEQQVKLDIYDTTLRDGTQGEGVNLSLADKLALTEALDAFGVDYIEGGWPGSNPKDEAFFEQVQSLNLKHAKVSAFGSTRRAKVAAAEDANLQKLVAANADVTCIFGKTWDFHVTEALRIDLSTNVEMIADSVAYLKKETGKTVFYDAEHFFDGFKANESYALDTVEAAWNAGAECLILCDTNGGALPNEVTMAVEKVFARLPDARVGIHT
ncbi:MAG: citramalate synthase, partial [Planctomycetes bacterium]|nr:citramalate synthase [Planctomycetota bacterium]